MAGGKIGSMIGRRRAFTIGCVIYGIGSLTTALAPNLAVLILGWSVLEGIGAALILPAIVALVAGNFPPEARPRAYGLVMGAGAIAVAVGPLIGGFATTYFSWRWVFVGEVVVVIGILALARRVKDTPPEARRRFDLAGAVLAAAGLGLAVLGILRSSEWGWIPLFLSVSLGLSALDTGVRILPLSITLLAAAIGIPRFFPKASPRRVVRLGLLAMFGGVTVLMAALDATADARIVTIPLLLAGLGIGALASQLGAVTVSAVPDELSPEVGGLQNTATNLGAAIGTALAGSLLISALTTSFLQGVEENPAIPEQVKSHATVQLAGGVPFLSDVALQDALDQAGVDPAVTQAALDINRQARVDGLRSALAVLALIALVGLFVARRVPDHPQLAAADALPNATGPPVGPNEAPTAIG